MKYILCFLKNIVVALKILGVASLMLCPLIALGIWGSYPDLPASVGIALFLLGTVIMCATIGTLFDVSDERNKTTDN